jgi:hypothetical protein
MIYDDFYLMWGAGVTGVCRSDISPSITLPNAGQPYFWNWCPHLQTYPSPLPTGYASVFLSENPGFLLYDAFTTNMSLLSKTGRITEH